jgi:hypothetical protein
LDPPTEGQSLSCLVPPAKPAVVDAVTAQVDRLFDYVTRPRLARALDRRSDGRLHLDPPG